MSKNLTHSPLRRVLAERNLFMQNTGKYFHMTDGTEKTKKDPVELIERLESY
jgi:hypothetical protein